MPSKADMLIHDIKEYLAEQLHITLHPDKIYLQHYTKGTKMVGAVIKPKRLLSSTPRSTRAGRRRTLWTKRA